MEEELNTTIAPEIEDMPDFGEETTETQVSEAETPKADTQKKEKKLSPYEQAILAEMQRRAEGGDELLADALKNEKKTIQGCFSYVTAQARKKAVGQCAMIEDAVVYGWAHHYYIESEETIQKELAPKVTQKADTNVKKAVETPKPVKNVLDITKAIVSATKGDTGKKREKKKDSLKAGFVPMERPETLKDAKKGSREQAKSIEQMDLFADFFAE